MFKKIKGFLNLNRSIEEKTVLLKKLEERIANKEELITETITEARQSIQAECDNILLNAKQQADKLLENSKEELNDLFVKINQLKEESNQTESDLSKKLKELKKLENTANKFKNECIGIQNLIEKFPEVVDYTKIENELIQLKESLGEGILDTIITLNLHHNDSKSLRKNMIVNNKEIQKLLKSYESRYTTKANKTIYHLMVIGLQSELQNILYTLSYTNLEKALDNAKALINKYLTICSDGNASILPTITRFLSELEPLFINAVQIEYHHYIQKEKEKEEQKRIKEQMRQEAEEQRLLKMEQKKIEKEEEKYINEIEKNKELLNKETDNEKIAALEARLKELEEQVEKLEEQKEEIVKRANGKAGYVYVISNLGSFGEDMFKIGMTRRLNPLDRVDELGDASVPFKFDIHAMIFSNDAVGLEQKLHLILDKDRVNKINLRKEFFYANVEKLQDVVQEIDPTVEFATTMMALEYRQSQSMKKEIIQMT